MRGELAEDCNHVGFQKAPQVGLHCGLNGGAAEGGVLEGLDGLNGLGAGQGRRAARGREPASRPAGERRRRRRRRPGPRTRKGEILVRCLRLPSRGSMNSPQ
ncbi:hypothetical protein BS78_01G442000 [Paspalum vaginatum]|nr:hypothetical protein BS78_01G442000 [Paspalum vaginatum]